MLMFVRQSEDRIVFSNAFLRLCLRKDATVESLVCIESGKEILEPDCTMPLFSVAQQRFYNNEQKLMHPCKRTTRFADAVCWKNGLLRVRFDGLPYEALVRVEDRERYITFTFDGFATDENTYRGLSLPNPPADSFTLLQLPVKKQDRYGEWMNTVSDGDTAVCVMAARWNVCADTQEQDTFCRMYARVNRETGMKNATAALFVSAHDTLLEKVHSFECDYHLPCGVQNRRGELINASAYWVSDATPQNIDEHIRFARRGGFRMMLFYYTCFFREEGGYALNGNYDFRDEYPNGLADIRAVLAKVNAAGITAGFHFLQTHIGIRSRYMTPNADHRVLHRQMLTLRKTISDTDTQIITDQCPLDDLPPNCRLLRIGTELVRYEAIRTEPPFGFIGCERGFNTTTAQSHDCGSACGVVWVSEFGASSVYIDQTTDLQDEIADKINAVYNCGFRFVYMDGSEGANPPFENYVPLAQWRVYKKCEPEPLFCEGAAKGHFSWHMFAGGNAFDVFPTHVFKDMIDRYPLTEAPQMQNDFTRLNFGWWALYEDTQPDTFEYGTSHAAGFDCPVAIQTDLDLQRKHPRMADIFEVMRRWEDVRAKKLLTQAQKEAIRQPQKEHTLLLNAREEYELVPCERIKTAVSDVTAYRFERNGKQWVSLWHNKGSCDLFLPADAERIAYFEEIDRNELPVIRTDRGCVIHVSDRRYLCTDMTQQEIDGMFLNVKELTV